MCHILHMKLILKYTVKYYNRIRAFFPSQIPQGLTEFESWATSIIEMADVPNNDSIRWSLATMVLHLNPTECYKPKEYFIRSLKKSAACEIAAYLMRELKAKQMAQVEEAKKAAEAAAQQTVVVSNEPVQN